MSDSDQLVAFAKSYLEAQPFDIVHDLEHHQLVYDNCVAIINAEEIHPHTEVIDTAAWWHDVDKSYQTKNSSDNTVTFFKKKAQEFGANLEFIAKVSKVISEHSFNGHQTTLESQILFDADKIEYVNANRISKFLNAIQAKPSDYHPHRLQETHDIWIFRLQKVPDKMHFKYSKKIFDERLSDTLKSLEKLQTIIDSY